MSSQTQVLLQEIFAKPAVTITAERFVAENVASPCKSGCSGSCIGIAQQSSHLFEFQHVAAR